MDDSKIIAVESAFNEFYKTVSDAGMSINGVTFTANLETIEALAKHYERDIQSFQGVGDQILHHLKFDLFDFIEG